MESAPADTAAVAGTVLVRNSRVNILTRVQEWDYYLGIAAVKRMQGLYQATLVAQGAFSLYLTEEVRRVGGWPDAIGEDIVLTWRLMESPSTSSPATHRGTGRSAPPTRRPSRRRPARGRRPGRTFRWGCRCGDVGRCPASGPSDGQAASSTPVAVTAFFPR